MGSEMCIRDRFSSLRLGVENLITKSPRFMISNTSQKTPAYAARPCLLYTSDAADERSSVDLGGRRIIKKKKKLTYCGDSLSGTTITKDTRLIQSSDRQ